MRCYHFRYVWILYALIIQSCIAQGQTIDRFETFNRHAYAMNKTLDKLILKPLATAYQKVLPWPVRSGVNNALNNLGEVSSFANHLLQGHMTYAAHTLSRFLINSTVGILGLFDVASRIGIERRIEDLGLTFARWGDKNSPYLVLPFFGPSTIRDGFAMPFNFIFLSIYPHLTDSKATLNGILALHAVNQRALLLDVEKFVDEAAFDPYVFERDAYLQHRKQLILRNDELNQHHEEDDTFIEPVISK